MITGNPKAEETSMRLMPILRSESRHLTQILLIANFRIPVGGFVLEFPCGTPHFHSHIDWILKSAIGILEKGETAIDCARRELLVFILKFQICNWNCRKRRASQEMCFMISTQMRFLCIQIPEKAKTVANSYLERYLMQLQYL